VEWVLLKGDGTVVRIGCCGVRGVVVVVCERGPDSGNHCEFEGC
jgi:hypothetical protein